mgnify:CR=1 FL=1
MFQRLAALAMGRSGCSSLFLTCVRAGRSCVAVPGLLLAVQGHTYGTCWRSRRRRNERGGEATSGVAASAGGGIDRGWEACRWRCSEVEAANTTLNRRELASPYCHLHRPTKPHTPN